MNINPILIAQLIGYLGLLLLVIRFFYDNRRTMLLFSGLANLIYSIHWFLLGGITASGLTFVAFIRNMIFRERTNKKWADNHYWFYTFLTINLLVGILAWRGYISLLPLTAATLGIAGLWSKNPTIIRHLNTIAMIPWFIYAIILGSQAMIIAAILIFTAGTINIIRFDWRKQ